VNIRSASVVVPPGVSDFSSGANISRYSTGCMMPNSGQIGLLNDFFSS
jgi:hypothetical protein